MFLLLPPQEGSHFQTLLCAAGSPQYRAKLAIGLNCVCLGKVISQDCRNGEELSEFYFSERSSSIF